MAVLHKSGDQEMATSPRATSAISLRGDLEAGGSACLRWFVIHTQPHCEMRALEHLKRQEFETFCPCARRSIRHARKKVSVLAPLFPSYIFVRLDLSFNQWRAINGTRGVVRLIANGDVPAAVPPGVIEAFQRQMDVNGAMSWSWSHKIGEGIRIADGPFADLVGTLQDLDPSGRVKVLLNLLGRSVCVVLRGESIEPIG